MRHTLLFIIAFVFFVGCSTKLDPSSLAFTPQEKAYHTYEKNEAKISSYFLNHSSEGWSVRSFITYIPFNTDEQLYSPFSSVKLTLERHTSYETKNIQEAMEWHIKKMGNKKLFHGKEEYLIENAFAPTLIQDIKEYNDKLDRDNNNDSDGVIIIP